MVMTLLTLAGLGIGAAQGFAASQERARDAQDEFENAEDVLDYTLARNEAQKAIVEGNLTISALSSNQAAKADAIAAYQAKSAAEAGLGGVGLTSGSTPFYKLATDVREMRSQLSEASKMRELQFDAQAKQAKASLLGLDFSERQARSGLMAAGEEAAYTDSAFAMFMGGATGAVAGMSTVNNLASLGIQTGLLSEDFLSADLFGGAFDAKTGVGTGPAYNQSVTPPVSSPLDFSYMPSVPQAAGRSDYQFTSQVLAPSMSSSDGTSYPNYYAQQQGQYSQGWGERKAPQWSLFF